MKLPFLVIAVLFSASIASAAPVPMAVKINPELVNEQHFSILSESDVKKDIDIGPAEYQRLTDKLAGIQRDYADRSKEYLIFGPNHVRTIGRDTSFESMYRDRAKCLSDHLTLTQFARLQQIERQRLSLFAFRDKTVSETLQLSWQQQRFILAQIEQFVLACNEYDRTCDPTLSEHYTSRILAELTSDQRQTWTNLLGKSLPMNAIGEAKTSEMIARIVREELEIRRIVPIQLQLITYGTVLIIDTPVCP